MAEGLCRIPVAGILRGLGFEDLLADALGGLAVGFDFCFSLAIGGVAVLHYAEKVTVRPFDVGAVRLCCHGAYNFLYDLQGIMTVGPDEICQGLLDLKYLMYPGKQHPLAAPFGAGVLSALFCCLDEVLELYSGPLSVGASRGACTGLVGSQKRREQNGGCTLCQLNITQAWDSVGDTVGES